MPAIYAHDRFGTDVREHMNETLNSLTNRFDQAYREGLQGPDIFFFITRGIITGYSAMVFISMRLMRLLFSAMH
ncbi:MAG: hypothetical protein LIO76_02605 [Clostridiales bacterium]|nr:hypothetical protein [Clostridiales bacterium]